jgi:tRNA-2-methylthio-N6-dimethylallyladenosine synthase
MKTAGFDRVTTPEDAEILIFYTCNVRENAARKVFSAIGMMKSSKTKVIAVGGCVAQAEKDGLFGKSDLINIIFGPHRYHRLPSYIQQILDGHKSEIIDVDVEPSVKFVETTIDRDVSFSEYVTIQEGCNNFCSYCVVPYTRGREYSRPAKDIISDVKELIASGSKEITLIGQNVNSYNGEAPYVNIGATSNRWKLDRLLYEIAGIEGIKRLRYTTSHPKDITTQLMEAHTKIPLLAPFAHIPIQSGSDKILKLMNRCYTSKEYLEMLKTFQDICPSIQFSSDFIVGFPTETEQDFEETVKVVDEVKYTISYAFKYSRRENTQAHQMDDQVSDDEKERRLEVLQKALLRSKVYRNQNLVGCTQEVLFDKIGKKEGQFIGKNLYMQSVIVESNTNLIGEFKNVVIRSAGVNCVFGSIA